MDVAESRCANCGLTKLAECFSKSTKAKNGLNSWCRQCSSEYHHANRDRLNAERKRRVDPERKSQVSRAYYRAHKEEIKARSSSWYYANKQRALEWSRGYRKSRPDVEVARRHRRRALVKGGFSASQWRDLRQFYNNTCLRCGLSEPDVKITADHVIPLNMGGSNDISNIQPLCSTCNSSKGARSTRDYRDSF